MWCVRCFDAERAQLGGSLIGGIRETQEMLDFCAQHGVAAITETIPIDQVNEAYTRMIKSDVKYRCAVKGGGRELIRTAPSWAQSDVALQWPLAREHMCKHPCQLAYDNGRDITNRCWVS